MAYVPMDYSEVERPTIEELYELVNGEYVLSEDDFPVEGKTYYFLDEEEGEEEEEGDSYAEIEVPEGSNPAEMGLYEYDSVEEDYVETADTAPVSGKTYYEIVTYSDSDRAASDVYDRNPYYPVPEDEVANPLEQGLYEQVEGGYELTQDAVPVDDKTYYDMVEDAVFEDIEDSDIPPSDTYFDELSAEETEKDDSNEAPIIDVRAENFSYQFMGFITDPHQEGLYELNNGLFSLTQDTEVVPEKAYYVYVENTDMYEADVSEVENFASETYVYYEKVDGEYLETFDESPESGKIYYRSRTEDETPRIEYNDTEAEEATDDDIPSEEELDDPDEDEEDEEDEGE